MMISKVIFIVHLLLTIAGQTYGENHRQLKSDKQDKKAKSDKSVKSVKTGNKKEPANKGNKATKGPGVTPGVIKTLKKKSSKEPKAPKGTKSDKSSKGPKSDTKKKNGKKAKTPISPPTNSPVLPINPPTNAPVLSPTKPPTSSSCVVAPFRQVTVDILTDYYPGEISWNIIPTTGSPDILMSGGSYTQTNFLYKATKDLGTCTYIFTINDSYADGICCQYGNGSYKVSVNGVEVLNGGVYGAVETKTFQVDAGTKPPVNTPTNPPVNPPTNAPVVGPIPPTNAPTNAPIPSPTNAPQEVVTVSTNKQSYTVREPVVISFSRQNPATQDYIGIFVCDNFSVTYDYDWTCGSASCTTPVASGTITWLTLPAGCYVASYLDQIDDEIAFTPQFNINTDPNTFIRTDKTSYTVGETVVVTYSTSFPNVLDWVGIWDCTTGLTNFDYDDTLGASTGTISFTDLGAGCYNAYFSDQNDQDIAASETFNIT
jgi:hypothetical protein